MDKTSAPVFVSIVLSITMLNNFLQSEYMLDIVNRLLGLDSSIPLNFEGDATIEHRMYMSLLHSIVLIVLVSLGAIPYVMYITGVVNKAVK